MPHSIIPIAVHIFLIKNKKVFLLKRKNTGFKDNMWSVPAGRVKNGESLTKAIQREAKEETGVQIKIKDLSEPLFMYHHNKKGERLYVFFSCNKWKGTPYNNEPAKSSEVKWFPINRLPKDLVNHVRVAIKSFLYGERFIEFGFE